MTRAMTELLCGSPHRMRLQSAMSVAARSLSSLTSGLARNCSSQSDSAWASCAAVHLAASGLRAWPVGRTIRNRPMKASSIGPCRPGRLAKPTNSNRPMARHRPSALTKRDSQERSVRTRAPDSLSPSMTTTGLPADRSGQSPDGIDKTRRETFSVVTSTRSLLAKRASTRAGCQCASRPST